ncbi:DUF2179 domain-containing protein [bacterium]|nr:DUF2179 domain-containing protein [bacterium]
MQNLTNPVNYIAYAAGYSVGTWIGIEIEQRIALGKVLIRTIISKEPSDLVQRLRDAGYPVTEVEGWGRDGEVSVLFMVAGRRKIPHVLAIIEENNPKAFYSIEDIRAARDTILPVQPRPLMLRLYHGPFRAVKKGK